jgi:hypothetical protein
VLTHQVLDGADAFAFLVSTVVPAACSDKYARARHRKKRSPAASVVHGPRGYFAFAGSTDIATARMQVMSMLSPALIFVNCV